MSFCHQLSLINPAVALIFAGCFVVVWRQLRNRHFLAFGAGFASYALGATIQVFSPPRDDVWTTLVATPFYIGAAFLIARGMLWRASVNGRVAWIACAAVALVEYCLLAYFHFAVPNLAARVYILNLGAALIFLIALAQLGRMRRGSAADRTIYWVFFVYTLNVVLRTLLSSSTPAGEDACTRAFSSYWTSFQVGQTLFNVFFCLVLLGSEIHALLGRIRHERDTDALTGLHNRRRFEEIARDAIVRTSGAPIGVILVDIDFFKFINDNYGHASGDAILVEFAQIVGRVVGVRGTPARLGGEEFAILLPRTTSGEAIRMAEDIRATLERARFEILPGSQRVTASFGVTIWRSNESLDALMSRADALLYTAKRSGRNCVQHGLEPAATLDADNKEDNKEDKQQGSTLLP